MEYNKSEFEVVSEVVAEVSDAQLRELDDLQLALIGGGAGDATFG